MWVMYVGYGLASEGLKGGLLQVGGAGTQYAFVIDYVFNFWNVLMFIFLSASLLMSSYISLDCCKDGKEGVSNVK